MLIKVTFLSLLLLSSCFQQRDRSQAFKSKKKPSNAYYSDPGLKDAESSRVSSGGNSPDSSTTDAAQDATPAEISHCSWSKDLVSGFNVQENAHLGPHTLCQSKQNLDDIYIQTKMKILDSQVCFIPLHHKEGKSIYIGEPRCLMLSDNSKIYRIKLYKNRKDYRESTITGVMMMKDKAYNFPPPFNQIALSPDAYIFCSQFLERYNYDGYCQAFKSVGEYVHKKF